MEIENIRVISCIRWNWSGKQSYVSAAGVHGCHKHQANNPSFVSCFLFLFCCVPLSDDRTYFDFVLFVIKTVGFRLIYVKSLQKREERKEKSLIITDPVATLAIGGVNFEAEKYGGKAATRKVSEEKQREKELFTNFRKYIISNYCFYFVFVWLFFFYVCFSVRPPSDPLFFATNSKKTSRHAVTHNYGRGKNKGEAETFHVTAENVEKAKIWWELRNKDLCANSVAAWGRGSFRFESGSQWPTHPPMSLL